MYILKAFKQNAFKLNNKKIERLSIFQQFLQQHTRQVNNDSLNAIRSCCWKECRQKQEKTCQQEEACGSKGRNLFWNNDVAARRKPRIGSPVVQN